MVAEINIPGEAATKVLYNFELLESILIHGASTIPELCDHDYHAERLRDLYRFQRINSTFRDVIARSKALQAIMFKTESQDNDSHFKINPLVNRLEWFGVPLESSRFARIEVKSDGHKTIHAKVTDLTNKETEWLAAGFIRESKGLAWRQMLLLDKPTPLSVDIDVVVGVFSGSYRLEIEGADRLGEFAELVLDVICDARAYRLNQVWVM